MRVAIGIDIGGTHIKGVLLREDGELLHRHHIPTQDDAAGGWLGRVSQMVGHLSAATDAAISTIGLSAPGLCDERNSSILHMPGRLSGLERLDWSGFLERPAHVLNDAHAALVAEARYGAVRGMRHAVLLTLGTGVGGAIWIDGALYQGLGQMAGHFGHTCLDPHDDETSILGMPGSLEYALGDYSVRRRSKGRFADTKELVEGHLSGDALATWLWLDMVRKLALAIASIGNSLSPQAVVLAGGITRAGDTLMVPLHRFLETYAFSSAEVRMEIRLAHFSDLSGAIGAAAFAFGRTDAADVHGSGGHPVA